MPTPDPIAFTLFGFEIRWYGILIAAAMIVAVLIVMRRAPKHGLDPENMLDVLIVSIISGVIGARLYYVVFNWADYASDPIQIFNFRGGGLAIHGGLILGILAGYFMCRYRKIGFLDALDLTVPAIAIAQAIGRWGNYFNSEAHGGPTDLPWAITVMGEKVHPTFLYESLWCLVLFFLLIAMDNRRKFVGQVACLYGILYSVERFLVESLRTDSLMIGPFKQAQVISITIIILCVIFYIWLQKRNKGEFK